jgi:hypothetical protein
MPILDKQTISEAVTKLKNDPKIREDRELKGYIDRQGTALLKLSDDLESEENLTQISEIIDRINEKIENARSAKKGKAKTTSKPEGRESAHSKRTPLLPPEGAEIREKLEADYAECLETLEFYNILEAGQTRYTADYDGSSEAGGAGEDFTGQTFEIPKMEEILLRLTPEQCRLYKEMEEKKLEPKLQLTPLALKLRTISGKLDTKKDELMEGQIDTYLDPNVYDLTMIYDPDYYETQGEGTDIKLIAVGGKTKSQIINECKGWQIRIIPMKQDLEIENEMNEIFKKSKLELAKTDSDVGGENELRNATKIALYREYLKSKGLNGLNYESYLMAQMQALKNKKTLEKDKWTILPDVALKNTGLVPYGYWRAGQVRLHYRNANFRSDRLRCRSSVVVL